MFLKKPQIKISETDEEKILTFDGAVFSIIKKRSIYTGLYWDYFTPLPLLYDKAKILIIGLGGGTMPYQLHQIYGDKVSVDVVEISGEMVRKAAEFNPTVEKIANIVVGDGIAYLSNCDSKYDIVILDAYERGLRIPNEFLSRSFIDKVDSVLKPNGVFGINYIFNLGQLLKFYRYMGMLKSRFNVYSISEGMYLMSNLILFCFKGMEINSMRTKIREGLAPDPNARHIFRRF